LAHTTTLAVVRITAEIIGASLPVYVLRISNTLQRRRKEQAHWNAIWLAAEHNRPDRQLAIIDCAELCRSHMAHFGGFDSASLKSAQ
jgi:hypothetical protein